MAYRQVDHTQSCSVIIAKHQCIAFFYHFTLHVSLLHKLSVKDGSVWEQFFICALQERTEEQENGDAVHLSTFTSNLTSQKQVVSKLEIPSLMGALYIWNSAFKLLTQQQFYSSS